MIFQGEIKISDITIIDYLLDKDVVVTNNIFKNNRRYNNELIKAQLVLANAIHKILMGYYSNSTTRINSIVGKKIENIKIEIKRSKSHLRYLDNKKIKNICDEFLLSNGEMILRKAEEGISYLEDIDYLGIINRSMKKNEICLGRIDEENLRVRDCIEIGTIKNIKHNLIEEDIYNYLRKIKRQEICIDIKSIVNEYINMAKLNKSSEEYINMLLMIPYDCLKYWRRYRENKRKITELEYLNNLKSAFKYEIGGRSYEQIFRKKLFMQV